ncbi:MAG: GGDEF domain-containing protein [Pseudomonadota bacterium]|nr:GGDEF domain-containing protein [Pseudomonadota bacterium]
MPKDDRPWLGLTGRTVLVSALVALLVVLAMGTAYLSFKRQGERVQRLSGVEVEQLMAATRLLQQAELLGGEGRLLAAAQTHAERRQSLIALNDRLEWVRRLMMELRQMQADAALLDPIDTQLQQLDAQVQALGLAVRERLYAPGQAVLDEAIERLLERHDALTGSLSAQMGLVSASMRRQVREQSQALVSEAHERQRELMLASAALLAVVLAAALYVELGVVRRVLRLKRMVDAGEVNARALGQRSSSQGDEITRLAATVGDYISRLRAHEREMERANEALAFQAEHDMLTRLPNRRHFEAASLHLLRETRQPVFAIVGDIDHFKCINDGHGHATGDLALMHVADVLRAGLRQGELVARMGGEEFVVLVPAPTVQEAARLAERMREYLACTPLVLADGSALPMTISFGLACVAVPPAAGAADDATLHAALKEALSAADGALYTAKHAGRNRLALAPARECQVPHAAEADMNACERRGMT